MAKKRKLFLRRQVKMALDWRCNSKHLAFQQSYPLPLRYHSDTVQYFPCSLAE